MLDVIESLLAERRAGELGGSPGDMGAMAMPMPSSGVELEDLALIANRHFGRGLDDGYDKGQRDGQREGELQGAVVQHARDTAVAMAVLDVVGHRLEGLQEALGVQEGEKGGKDTRTRSELREEAVAALDAIRAGLAVVGVKLADGEL